jgi:hypothetical protein
MKEHSRKRTEMHTVFWWENITKMYLTEFLNRMVGHSSG